MGCGKGSNIVNPRFENPEDQHGTDKSPHEQRVEFIREYFNRGARDLRRNIVVLVWAMIKSHESKKQKLGITHGRR